MHKRWQRAGLHTKSTNFLDVRYVVKLCFPPLLHNWLLTFLSSIESLFACCKQHHSYNFKACITSEGEVVDHTAILYYPDWDGNNVGCLADGNAPDHMVANPTYWMFDSLSDCCERFYSWDLSRCDSTDSSTSNLWCMSWDSNTCVQGCNSWDYTYETQLECCDQR